MRYSEETDASLVSLFVAGNSDALEVLIKRYYSYIYRVCWRIVRNKQEVEDLTQDIVLKLCEKVGSFRNESAFSSWLYAFSSNYCYAHITRGSYKTYINSYSSEDFLDDWDAGPDTDPEKVFNTSHNMRTIVRSIKYLPYTQKESFRLRLLEEKSYTEIAKELSVAEGTVKSSISRAKKKMFDLVEDEVIF